MTSSALSGSWLENARIEANGCAALQPDGVTRAALSAWLSTECERVTDPTFGENFARGCPVPGARPSDYQQRVLSLPGFGESLAGIRFVGGDTARPFVDLLAWSQRPHDWGPDLTAIAEAFGLFQPRHVRVLLADSPPLAASVDQVWMAGPLSQRTTPPTTLDIQVGGPEDAPMVADAYRAAIAAAPHLDGRLFPCTAEDLSACSTVVRLCVDGRWAGLAAATRHRRWALDGYEVAEEILAPSFRGRGLGPHLQQALIRACAEDSTLPLFGTIDSSNAPSLATARRCGREAVARWWFVSLQPPA